MDKIICVGKNYLDHVHEMGGPPPPKPLLFLKPESVLKEVPSWGGHSFMLEFIEGKGPLHHEIEIIFRMQKGKIEALSIGLDMTLRDLQFEAKETGHPWTISKVFRDAAVVGPFIPVADFPDYMNVPFTLTVDGKIRQESKGNHMMVLPEDFIPYIDECFPICDGDLIFTGTPAGIGPVHKGSKATLNWGKYHYSVEWR